MANRIIGKEYPLSEIFSKEFEYYIPGYQRPYAWSKKETEELFDDLFEAFSVDKDDTYFLGSIVLVKEENKPKAEVIDGQQRLTTLTMLIAVISTYLSEDLKDTWNQYLMEKGNEFVGLTANPRIHLRDKDQRFFYKYIQKVDLDGLENLNESTLDNESQVHIRTNCKILRDRIEEEFSGNSNDIFEFGKFLIGRCYLIAVSTPTPQSAFRVFSIMNDRGMNLLPTDIIKSRVIGMIADEKQKEYTDKWEEMEIQTTRQGFNDVIIHTRMIFAKSKAKANILDEFNEHVLSRFSPEELIDSVVGPFSEAYSVIVNKNYSASRNAEIINSYLFWLNKVDNSDWMPAAIKFFAEEKNDSDYVLWFLTKFERLVACLYITSSDRRQRIDRFAELLDEMEKRPDHSLQSPLTSIELTSDEKKEFIKALDGEIYKMTPLRRNYVILRLNAFLSDGANRFDSEPNILTIEHVLPQTIKAGSEWERLWPDSDTRDMWLNRISNLVPLTRKKNSAAQNYDFDRKKNTYFSTVNGVTTYPLTTQVIREEKWTPEVLERRQEELIKKFSDSWDLDYAPLNIDKKDSSSASCEENQTENNTEEFNIDDETTYHVLKVGKLAYELIKRLLESERISDEEIEKLKGKPYTKSLFNETDYPVLANHREDHMGNGKKVRYRKKPVSCKGSQVFISTEWYEGDRENLIVWYKQHL